MLQGKVLRVARPTDRLDRVVHFYTEGLGLQIIDRFENHEGFDGLTLPGVNARGFLVQSVGLLVDVTTSE
jgi:catechol 2,3-dioxygenase-like lactoylglutathione lyase family enzyme